MRTSARATFKKTFAQSSHALCVVPQQRCVCVCSVSCCFIRPSTQNRSAPIRADDCIPAGERPENPEQTNPGPCRARTPGLRPKRGKQKRKGRDKKGKPPFTAAFPAGVDLAGCAQDDTTGSTSPKVRGAKIRPGLHCFAVRRNG